MRRSTLLITCLMAILCIGLAAPLAKADKGHRANATVSFGQWQTPLPPPAVSPQTDPLDRFPNLSPRNRNNHQLIPNEVKIKVGGSVNFIIGGFHRNTRRGLPALAGRGMLVLRQQESLFPLALS